MFLYHLVTVANGDLNCFRRRERLQTVRALFYNAYCSTIGFRFKNGHESGLGSLLGNIAEKVGIISTQRTSV
jgi:myotubularin-related protein 14